MSEELTYGPPKEPCRKCGHSMPWNGPVYVWDYPTVEGNAFGIGIGRLSYRCARCGFCVMTLTLDDAAAVQS